MEDKKNCLLDYPWTKQGARYGELIAWLKENSGYTSNRCTDRILKDALLSGLITKRLNTRRYYLAVFP